MRRTEECILQAALRLFAAKGLEGTSIRDIASAAEVKTASLYHYMDTKEDLLVTIMERGLVEQLEAVRKAAHELRAPEQRLAALVQLHVAYHGINRLSALVADNEFRALSQENRTKIGRLRDEYESYWRDTLGGGISAGVFRIEDAKLAGLALLEMCTGVVHWYSPDGPLSLRDIEVGFADMALALVRAEREGGRQIRAGDLDLPDPVRFLPAGVRGHEEVEA